MKSKILLLFLLSPLFIEAQATYRPFIQDSAVWVIHVRQYGFPHLTYGYQMKGDTTVDNQDYKKIYRLTLVREGQWWDPPFELGSTLLFGIVREDSGKVYAIQYEHQNNCFATDEFLLFDFTLQPGDTTDLCINGYGPKTITEIGFSNLWNTELIRSDENDDGYEYINGIGTYNGLFETAGDGFWADVTLDDYCIGGLADCNIFPTGILDQSAPEKCTNIRFNPATSSLQIDQPPQQQTELQLFNTTGGLVGEYQLNGQSEVNINPPAGMYIMHATQNDGSRCVMKTSKAN